MNNKFSVALKDGINYGEPYGVKNIAGNMVFDSFAKAKMMLELYNKNEENRKSEIVKEYGTRGLRNYKFLTMEEWIESKTSEEMEELMSSYREEQKNIRVERKIKMMKVMNGSDVLKQYPYNPILEAKPYDDGANMKYIEIHLEMENGDESKIDKRAISQRYQNVHYTHNSSLQNGVEIVYIEKEYYFDFKVLRDTIEIFRNAGYVSTDNCTMTINKTKDFFSRHDNGLQLAKIKISMNKIYEKIYGKIYNREYSYPKESINKTRKLAKDMINNPNYKYVSFRFPMTINLECIYQIFKMIKDVTWDLTFYKQHGIDKIFNMPIEDISNCIGSYQITDIIRQYTEHNANTICYVER